MAGTRILGDPPLGAYGVDIRRTQLVNGRQPDGGCRGLRDGELNMSSDRPKGVREHQQKREDSSWFPRRQPSPSVAALTVDLLALQRTAGNGAVHRALEARPSTEPTEALPAVVRKALASEPGRPLDPANRQWMESRFGHGFGGVRIHDDPAAQEASDQLNADAFTVGQDVFITPVLFDPRSGRGARLLAHELAHVVQQEHLVWPARPLDTASDPHETYAARAAETALTGGDMPKVSGTGVPTVQRQRRGEEEAVVPLKAEEKSDPAVDALDLKTKAKKVANRLKAKYSEISFTSGKRDETQEQASAMAENVVSNRNWITETYADKTLAKELQKWLDDNPKAKTKDEISAGLKSVMDGWTEERKGRLSAHFTGEAFDIQPQDKKATEIKADAKSWAEADGGKFLEKEGGLVRWHTQVRG
jgi:hypothetical protein